MDTAVRNLLYRRPEFYEQAVPERNDETPKMCRRIFSRFLATPPSSILDIGCGTGRDLDSLTRDIPDCWGVDFLPEMIEYAKARRPHLNLRVGDMRVVRLGRTFDVIMSMGSAFMYALSNEDIERTLETFAAHSHIGTLLILDINNAASYLGAESFKPKSALPLAAGEFRAEARSEYSFDRRKQVMVRRRTWKIEGDDDVDDFCEYRLLFPAEIEHLLNEHGFRVEGMFDNMELRPSDLSGARLYVAAILAGEAQHG